MIGRPFRLLRIARSDELRKKAREKFGERKKRITFATAFERECDIHIAEIAQLVEHNLAKVGVASSSLVFRS